jgi:hypothetical protein
MQSCPILLALMLSAYNQGCQGSDDRTTGTVGPERERHADGSFIEDYSGIESGDPPAVDLLLHLKPGIWELVREFPEYEIYTSPRGSRVDTHTVGRECSETFFGVIISNVPRDYIPRCYPTLAYLNSAANQEHPIPGFQFHYTISVNSGPPVLACYVRDGSGTFSLFATRSPYIHSSSNYDSCYRLYTLRERLAKRPVPQRDGYQLIRAFPWGKVEANYQDLVITTSSGCRKTFYITFKDFQKILLLKNDLDHSKFSNCPNIRRNIKCPLIGEIFSPSHHAVRDHGGAACKSLEAEVKEWRRILESLKGKKSEVSKALLKKFGTLIQNFNIKKSSSKNSPIIASMKDHRFSGMTDFVVQIETQRNSHSHTFPVVLDTGSDVLVMYSRKSGGRFNLVGYDSSGGRAQKEAGCNTVDYVDGVKFRCDDAYREKILLGGETVDMAVHIPNDREGMSALGEAVGILGVSPGSEFMSSVGYFTIKPNSNHFEIFLKRKIQNFCQKFEKIKILKQKSNQDLEWRIPLEISVGDGRKRRVDFLIDTGATASWMPKIIWDEIRQDIFPDVAAPASSQGDKISYVAVEKIECEKLKRNLPNLHFHFPGGSSIQMTPNQYTHTRPGSRPACLLGINSKIRGTLGVDFLKNLVTEFNAKEGYIAICIPGV